MPKVSVIIPVYKVEKYLEECLDSVLAQTLHDIEVIAVNDGSPDRCPQILDDYAAKDSRITVIHKENAGVSAARNAAYPLIRGEYTLIIDSDDYIDKTLCEKAVTIADRERADMTLFFFHSSKNCHHLENFLKKHPFSDLDKLTLACHMAPWNRLWKSAFLLDNQITFPVGVRFEDYVMNWKAIVLAPKLSLLPEKLYHYRITPGSFSQAHSWKSFIERMASHDIVKKILIETKKYDGEWKDAYLHLKLATLFSTYLKVSPHDRDNMLKEIVSRLDNDERDFLKRSRDLHFYARAFYASINGSIGDKLWFSLLSGLYTLRCGLKKKY